MMASNTLNADSFSRCIQWLRGRSATPITSLYVIPHYAVNYIYDEARRWVKSPPQTTLISLVVAWCSCNVCEWCEISCIVQWNAGQMTLKLATSQLSAITLESHSTLAHQFTKWSLILKTSFTGRLKQYICNEEIVKDPPFCGNK